MDHVDLEMTFPTPPERLWAALTESSWLERWFAEHGEISPPTDEAAGVFRFWGRYTPDTPDATQADHPLTAYQAGRRLTFEWPWAGVDGGERLTRVTWEVSPEGSDGGRLRLLHENVGEWKSGFSWTDYWYSLLETLRAHLAGREPGVRPDFSRGWDDPITLALTLDAPSDEVFEALIDPEQLERYFPASAEVERRVGGRLDFGWDGGGPRQILELEEGRLLVYSWQYGEDPETVVRWELEGSDGGTHLTLVHSGFGRPCPDYWVGWLAVVNQLKGLVEVGECWSKARVTASDVAEHVEA